MNRLLIVFFAISSLLCAQGRIEPRMLKQGGATTNQILVWNGTIWTPDDNSATIGEQDYIDFDNDIVAPSYLEGRLFYDQDSNALAYYNDDENVTLQIGQELWIRAKNETGSTLLDGQAVYVNGAVGASGTPTVALALADSMDTVKQVGVVTANILNNTFGYVTATGIVRGIDTDGLGEGNLLYVSASVAGALTATPPTSPNYRAPVAYVVNDHASNGSIFVFRETAHIGAATTTDYFRGDESWQTLQADAVAFTPAGSIAATDTQAAVEEVSGDTDGHPSASMTFINKEMNDLSNHIDADATHIGVRNVSGATLDAGDIVYVSGYNIGLDLPQVDLADNDDAATMPAFCVMEIEALNNATGHCQVSGTLHDVPTNGLTVGDELYVDSTAGAWTTTRPTGVAEAVQKIGIVLRVHASLGIVNIVGAGRSNDIPNYIDAADVGNKDVDDTELSYVNNVSSAIQTQLNAKEGTLTNSAGLANALSDEVGNAGGFTRGTAGSTDDCVKWDANGNLVSNGSGCASAGGYATIDDEDTPLTQRTTLNFAGGGVTCADDTDQTTCTIAGGGATSFDTITAGTNANALVVGTGGTLGVSGSGTIASTTAAALAANGANCDAGNYPLGVDDAGAVEDCTADDTGTDNQTAAEVSNTPAGDIEATDVQAAIDELDDEKAATGDIIAGVGNLTTVEAIPYTSASGTLNESGLHWDVADLKMGINTTTPEDALHVTHSTDPRIRITGPEFSAFILEVSGGSNPGEWAIVQDSAGDFKIQILDGIGDVVGLQRDGTVTITGPLIANGEIDLNDPGAQPTCDSSTRGQLWFDEGTGGVADTFDTCAKDKNDLYAWESNINGNLKTLAMVVFDFTTDIAIGDGKFYFPVQSTLNGGVITGVHAQVITAGLTSGTTTIQIGRCAIAATGNACSGAVDDVLSTELTVDFGENSSHTAAAAAVIDTGNDDLLTNQVLRVDVDALSNTTAKGLIVTIEVTL